MFSPRVTRDVILTHSGRYVRPLALDPEDVDVVDIAHALSHQCRFSGHVRQFYSVAEHSCRVCDLVGEQEHDPYVELWALLHDASEAYLVDLPRPVKHSSVLGHEYIRAERLAMEAICVSVGLDGHEPEVVRTADRVLLATERRDLMPANGDWQTWLEDVEPLDYEIEPWKPCVAKAGFMRRYVTLATRLGRL